MAFFNWSQTAATNASADPSINWAEGQAPSSVNDSARAVMARLREWGNDIAGAIVTGGTSTAYTVTSNQVFDSLAHLNGQVIAFTPHTTNGATVTLNVDSLGAKPLRWAPSVELQSGVLVQGTPYIALYNSSDAAFYLRGNGVGAPGIPLGASIDYWGSSAPTTSYALAYGQAISRTTYATLFTLFSTTYGTGDGSTTFNIPDLRGRVIAGKDDMGGSAASRLTSTTITGGAATLGNIGGEQTHTSTLSELPTGITVSGSINVNNAGSNSPVAANQNVGTFSTGTGGATQWQAWGTGASVTVQSLTATGSMTSNNTSGAAHNNVQPTIIANKLIRII